MKYVVYYDAILKQRETVVSANCEGEARRKAQDKIARFLLDTYDWNGGFLIKAVKPLTTEKYEKMIDGLNAQIARLQAQLDDIKAEVE